MAIVRDQELVAVAIENVTFDATAGGIGFTAANLTVDGQQVRLIKFTLETAQIRFSLLAADAPTTTNGNILEIGDVFSLAGFNVIKAFRGIRTGGTSGVAYVTFFV